LSKSYLCSQLRLPEEAEEEHLDCYCDYQTVM